MSFIANVKADFRALPQRFRSDAMPKIIVGLNIGLCALMWIGAAVDGEMDDVEVVLILLEISLLYMDDVEVVLRLLGISLLYLVVTYLVLSQRLKITLSVILSLVFLLVVYTVIVQHTISDREILFVGSWLLFPVANIIILWTWTPNYRVRRWKSSGPVSSDGVSEEQLFATVWAELESGDIQQGLWAKIWSESKGDENKTKAAYLKARVIQLLNEVVDDETLIPPTKTAEEPVVAREKNKAGVLHGHGR